MELVGKEGGVDALINNAGVNLDDKYTVENVKMTLKTNYEGTLEVCLPLLLPGNKADGQTDRR